MFELWGWSFCWKCLKLFVDFRNEKKNKETKNNQKMFLVLVIMAFEPVAGICLCYENISCVRPWTCYQTVVLFQIWLREMFANSILSQINGKSGQKRGRGEFISVWDPETRWFLKGLVKRELSVIQVTTFFGVNTFQNISAMKLIFLFKMRKISCRF